MDPEQGSPAGILDGVEDMDRRNATAEIDGPALGAHWRGTCGQ
ncbi:MAG: hypothetical protein ACTH0P_10380 [Candidatus Corynebacterium faecigallinarum]|nr:hypothetical protein [Corynebacterium sp.]